MNNLLFLLFLVFALSLSGQHTSITAEDFNSDGAEDLLKCSYEIGSHSGGSDCELTDGKTKNKFTLNNQGCLCLIKNTVSVHPELRKKENEYFFYTLKKEVLPKFRAAPDQSLFWIINSALNTKRPSDHPYFNLIFNPNTAWRGENPEFPSTYYIEVSALTLTRIIPNYKASIGSNIRDHKDMLVYYGNTHSSTVGNQLKDFVSVAKNETYEILKTAHGVIAKKDNTYKWLFVTDIDINASPQKLRWTSIEEVVLHDNYVIIKQGLAPDPEYNIYVIDIEKGAGGRLKIDFDFLTDKGIEISDLNPEERFSIIENTIHIGKKREILKFPLTEIRLELEVLTKRN